MARRCGRSPSHPIVHSTGQLTTVPVTGTVTQPFAAAASTSAREVKATGVSPAIHVTVVTCRSGVMLRKQVVKLWPSSAWLTSDVAYVGRSFEEGARSRVHSMTRTRTAGI